MFARLDFSTFLICYSEDLSGNKSEEKLLLQFVVGQAIIWHRLTGLNADCDGWVMLSMEDGRIPKDILYGELALGSLRKIYEGCRHRHYVLGGLCS